KRAAKDGELGDLRDVLDLEIGDPTKVAADIREHGQSTRSNDRAADGEPVQSVGKVYRVRRADNHRADKHQEGDKCYRPPVRIIHQGMNHEIGVDALGKGNHQ